MLTLVFLAAGLLQLSRSTIATVASPAETSVGAGDTRLVLRFLEDLAYGMVLTIFGLGVRQVRILGRLPRAVEMREGGLDSLQNRLAEAIESFLSKLHERPENVILEEISQTQAAARQAAKRLHDEVVQGADRMRNAVGELEKATGDAAATLARSVSATSENLGKAAESLEARVAELLHRLRQTLEQAAKRITDDVGRALDALEQQRETAVNALAESIKEAGRIREEAERRAQEHLAQWRSLLEATRTALNEVHRSLDEEYQRGIEKFQASGNAFAKLTERTLEHVQSLPDPSERLAGLWDGVRRLESDLAQAVTASVRELEGLRQSTMSAEEALTRFGESTGDAARHVMSGGGEFAEALKTELERMNRVIDEYVELLENTTRNLRVRV